MEDHRLPDAPDRKKCPVEGCRDYAWLMKHNPDDPGTFHCHIHNPHCLQVGHTHEDATKCARERCHSKAKIDVQAVVAARVAAAEAAASKR